MGRSVLMGEQTAWDTGMRFPFPQKKELKVRVACPLSSRMLGIG